MATVSERAEQIVPQAPVAPEVERKVQELLRRPYRMVVRGDPEEGYLATAPELPGCVTAGETPEEAMALLRDAMYGWLVVAVERGDAVPVPAGEPLQGYSGKFVLRVPKSLHRRLAERAEEEGVSLNQFALTCLALGLGTGASGAGAAPAWAGTQLRTVIDERVQIAVEARVRSASSQVSDATGGAVEASGVDR